MIRNIFGYYSSSSFRVSLFRKGNTRTIESHGMYDSPAAAKQLLECVVGQAMGDGMLNIAIGLQQEPVATWMKYGGLHESDSLTRWDMVPPPPGIYPFMYQYLIGAMTITELPLSGTMKALIGFHCVELDVSMNGFEQIDISWKSEAIDTYRHVAKKAG